MAAAAASVRNWTGEFVTLVDEAIRHFYIPPDTYDEETETNCWKTATTFGAALYNTIVYWEPFRGVMQTMHTTLLIMRLNLTKTDGFGLDAVYIKKLQDTLASMRNCGAEYPDVCTRLEKFCNEWLGAHPEPEPEV